MQFWLTVLRQAQRPEHILFSQSPGTEKSTGIRLRATERKVEGHRFLAAPLLKEGLAELQSHLRIVYSLLLEVLESVLVQNLGPEIAIVAGTVTAVEDVVEVGRAVAWDDLVDCLLYTSPSPRD